MFRRQKNSGNRTQTGPLVEYLYIDTKRVDAYFEQISAPVTFEKVPTFGGSLGISGPSVSASQAAHARHFTNHEKVTALTDYLTEGGYLGTSRPGDLEYLPTAQIFRSEICQGTRVLIPNGDQYLPLWICDPLDSPQPVRPVGSLYLIEDFRQADYDGTDHKAVSSFSALTMLVEEVGEPDLAIGPGAWDNEASRHFSMQPFELVERLGGTVGSSRTIETLYRIRATLADRDSIPSFATVTIGYPIVIKEAAAASP